MSPSHAFAQRLASGEMIAEPVGVVVAHPDDESLWAGTALPRLTQLALVHVTDGAPLDMTDAAHAGFATREDYAHARQAELDAALDALDVRPKRLAYGIIDRQAAEQIGALAERLARDLAGMAAIVTHPYEGGHPDHDAAALAARLAADRIGTLTGTTPALVEFTCYHIEGGERRFGRFWPDAGSPEQVRPLDAADRARADRAITAHHSQAAMIGGWRPEAERWRAAPTYDFTAPPPPGTSLYDGFGWAMTSARWRRHAAEELAAWA
jgi:LmbE family N-acetylglucosaminyl deacetylase